MVVAGSVISIPFILVFSGLVKRFPSKNLLEIFRIVFGKPAGIVISILYIALYLLTLSLFLNDIAAYYTEFVQTEAPSILFIAAAILGSALVLLIGIQYLVKASAVIAMVVLLTIIVSFLLLLGKMDFSNLLPIMRQEPKVYLESISQFVLVPCCQINFLFMLTPKLRSARHFTKTTLAGFAIGTVAFLIVSIRNTATLGPMASVVNSASFVSMRMIEIGDIFTRVDFAFSVNITVLIFFSICIIHHAAALGLTQLFGLKSIRWFIVPAGAIAVILTMTLFNSTLEHIEFSKKYNVLVFSAFNFIIPPITLLTAKLRKLKETADIH